jgi:predicted transposase/invertase (TIGR01784 family)
MQDKYLNPFTDFGFKKLFGEEPNKDLLISFLNSFLPERHKIHDLQYTKHEYQGYTALDRKAIFDLNCISTSGERFIVELQKAKQNYFKDRSLYYATFPIQEQAQRGDWDYKLSAVYTVGILDFVFDEDRKQHDRETIHHVQLKDQAGQVFYDKLTFIYLTLPNFHKQRAELKTLQDKWLYVFRHLAELDEIPVELQESIFLKLFQVAQIAQFNPQERQAYEDSLKYYRDLKNVTDTAFEDGIEKGIDIGVEKGISIGVEQGKVEGKKEGERAKAIEIARNLLDVLDDATIAMKTGLSAADIRQLRIS